MFVEYSGKRRIYKNKMGNQALVNQYNVSHEEEKIMKSFHCSDKSLKTTTWLQLFTQEQNLSTILRYLFTFFDTSTFCTQLLCFFHHKIYFTLWFNLLCRQFITELVHFQIVLLFFFLTNKIFFKFPHFLSFIYYQMIAFDPWIYSVSDTWRHFWGLSH